MSEEMGVLSSRKRASSSVTLVVGGLVLALVAVMAIPMVWSWWSGDAMREEMPDLGTLNE
jgi:pilus assembly protein CpaF